MKINPHICFLFLVIFLVGCASASPTAPFITPLPITPTVTLVVATTTKPTPTATVTIPPTRQPTPTFTPYPTRIPEVEVSPTPIATPPGSVADYQLKPWNEQAALDLVDIAEEYSFAVNIPYPFGGIRTDFQQAQVPIKTVAQEALLRFPNSQAKDTFAWRIALANVLLDSHASDAWILSALQVGLNKGLYDPSDLNAVLNPHGFTIVSSLPAPNLFGDGQDAEVFWLSTQDSPQMGGLYFALRQHPQGNRTLEVIDSYWDFLHGSNYPDNNFLVEDHTQDGVPEIIFQDSGQSGSICGARVLIYQWHDGRFVNLTLSPGNPGGIFPYGCEGEWSYGQLDNKGVATIEVRRFNFYPGYWIQEHYQWSGEWYELMDESVELPVDFISDDLWLLLDDPLEQRWYATQISETQKLLTKSPFTGANEFGPSYPDFLRFQLGLAYALQSQTDQAQETFQSLVDNPVNPLTGTLSSATKAYLANYQDDTDVYRACSAALQVMDKALPAYETQTGYEDIDTSAWWGYGAWPRRAICSLRGALEFVVQTWTKEQASQMPALLNQAGVNVNSLNKQDVNSDGQDDWVVIIDTPGDDVPFDIWVLLTTATGVTPLPLIDLERRAYDLLEQKPAHIQQITAIPLPNDDGSIVALDTSYQTWIFRIVSHGQTFKLVRLLSFSHGEQYAVREKDGLLELAVGSDCTDGVYQWEPLFFDFRLAQCNSMPKPNNWQNLLREGQTTLLAGQDPKSAIPLLARALSLWELTEDGWSYHASHIQYLLGLSYELSGDERQAVKTYWELWRDYPETPYALMAREKLQLISP